MEDNLIHTMFEAALKHRDANRSAEAIDILKQITVTYPHDPKIYGVYTVFGSVYQSLKILKMLLPVFEQQPKNGYAHYKDIILHFAKREGLVK